jgi:hypothetical protein
MSRKEAPKTTLYVVFLIRGDDFDPQVITEKLNIEPTDCFAKNTDEKPKVVFENTPKDFRVITPKELRTILSKMEVKKGKKKLRPHWFSLWEISTRFEESIDVNDHLLIIYNDLRDKVDILNELRNKFDLRYTMLIVTEIENCEAPMLGFDNYIIDFAHEIRADIDIDLYVYS